MDYKFGSINDIRIQGIPNLYFKVISHQQVKSKSNLLQVFNKKLTPTHVDGKCPKSQDLSLALKSVIEKERAIEAKEVVCRNSRAWALAIECATIIGGMMTRIKLKLNIRELKQRRYRK